MRQLLIAVALGIGLLAAACGAAATPTPPTATATPFPTATMAPTATPTIPVETPTSKAPTPTPGAVEPETPTPTARPTPTLAPAPTAPARKAILEIRATDAPPPKGMSKILVTVSNIEVNMAVGDEAGGWSSVVSEPKTFDLIEITGVEELLGTAELAPGEYKQVRLNVEEVTVTLEGTAIQSRVPSGKLRFKGRFTVVAGQTTILTLDFEAGKSVVVTGRGHVIVKPVIKLLIRKGGEPLSAAKVAPSPEPTATTEPTATPTAASTTTPTGQPTPIPPTPTTRAVTATPEPTPTPTPTPQPTATPAPTPTAIPTATPAPTPTPTPEGPQITSDIEKFALKDLTIKVGTTVTWKQKDRGTSHTSTSGIGGSDPKPDGVWDRPEMTQGGSFRHTFKEAGIFQYYCRVHPTIMSATVTVEGNSDGQAPNSSPATATPTPPPTATPGSSGSSGGGVYQ